MDGLIGTPGLIWIVVAVILFLVLIFMIAKAVDAGSSGTDLSNAVDADNSGNDVSSAVGAGSIGVPSAFLSSVPKRFVVFDLETTGLDPMQHEIIEIGAIRVNCDSNVHETFQALVKPLRHIPRRITQINGISQDIVDNEGEPLETVIGDFVAFIEDLPLVSFNAEFDMAFLRSAAKRHKIVIPNSASCALKMARRAWPGRQSYRLCDLARDGNLSDEGAHRALADCKRTIFVYTAAAIKLALRDEGGV